MIVLFIYHKFCRDGFAAAAVSFKYYLEQYERNSIHELDIVYKALDPSQVKDSVDNLIKDFPQSVTVVAYDLAFTYLSFKKLATHFVSVEVWDHHVSTKSECIDMIQKDDVDANGEPIVGKIHYVQENCGAVLAFKNYYPNKQVPDFLLYVQDRDLWKETQPDSKLINAGLFEALPLEYLSEVDVNAYIKNKLKINISKFNIVKAVGDYNVPYFENWITCMESSDWIPRMKNNGEIILKLQNKSITHSARSAELFHLGEHRVYIINCGDQHISDICNYLYQRQNESGDYLCDYVMAWRFNHQTNLVYVSLRSRQGTGADVSKLAIEFVGNEKGGGHENAAGFECDMKRFNEIVKFFETK